VDDTAFLEHFFPGTIELLIPKFAERFEDLAVIIDGFFDQSEFLRYSDFFDVDVSYPMHVSSAYLDPRRHQ
jgi:hypothetical protein